MRGITGTFREPVEAERTTISLADVGVPHFAIEVTSRSQPQEDRSESQIPRGFGILTSP